MFKRTKEWLRPGTTSSRWIAAAGLIGIAAIVGLPELVGRHSARRFKMKIISVNENSFPRSKADLRPYARLEKADGTQKLVPMDAWISGCKLGDFVDFVSDGASYEVDWRSCISH